MKLLRPLIDLLLYSNFYIAACAYALAWQTFALYPVEAHHAHRPILGFIFFATLTTYALHRIIGLYRLTPFLSEGRYEIISRFKTHIWLYALIGAMGSAITFIHLPHRIQGWVVVPALLSIGYVFPLFGRGRYRLRDYAGLKIFLVAGVWAWVTGVLPLMSSDIVPLANTWPLFLERFSFIFATTLAFDIRDMRVDAHNRVHTLPTLLGVRTSIALALILLIVASIIAHYEHLPDHAHAIWVVNAIAGLLVLYAPRFLDRDYYFTGLIDGTMLLHGLAIWLADYLYMLRF